MDCHEKQLGIVERAVDQTTQIRSFSAGHSIYWKYQQTSNDLCWYCLVVQLEIAVYTFLLPFVWRVLLVKNKARERKLRWRRITSIDICMRCQWHFFISSIVKFISFSLLIFDSTSIVTCCCERHVGSRKRAQMRKLMSINHSVNFLFLFFLLLYIEYIW